jgi:hypothetical protein
MTTHRWFFLIFAVVLLFIPVWASSQDRNIKNQAFGIVVYAEGGEVAIFRKGEYITFDLSLADIVGLPILEGDLIQTEKASFLELQMYPTETIVKIAENTTFTVVGLSAGGGATLDLAYGRLRSKVQKISGRDPFLVRGRGAVAGVRGTDFGYDFVAERDGAGISADTKIYCFEGAVEITGPEKLLESPGPQKAPEVVIITANEMVRVRETRPAEVLPPDQESPPVPESRHEKVLVFEKTEIEKPVLAFWDKNTFQAEPTPIDKIQAVFPDLPELLKSETVQPEKFKRPEPIIRKEEVPDSVAPPPVAEAAPAVPAPEPQKPAVVEADWQQRIKELQRTRLRVGSLGLFAIGAATFFISMQNEAGPASGMVFMVGGGLLSLVGTGLFASTFGD